MREQIVEINVYTQWNERFGRIYSEVRKIYLDCAINVAHKIIGIVTNYNSTDCRFKFQIERKKSRNLRHTTFFSLFCSGLCSFRNTYIFIHYLHNLFSRYCNHPALVDFILFYLAAKDDILNVLRFCDMATMNSTGNLISVGHTLLLAFSPWTKIYHIIAVPNLYHILQQ